MLRDFTALISAGSRQLAEGSESFRNSHCTFITLPWNGKWFQGQPRTQMCNDKREIRNVKLKVPGTNF
jgi:hypothetical protein